MAALDVLPSVRLMLLLPGLESRTRPPSRARAGSQETSPEKGRPVPSLQLWGWGELDKCLIGISSAGGWVVQRAMSRRRLEGRLWDWLGNGFSFHSLSGARHNCWQDHVPSVHGQWL